MDAGCGIVFDIRSQTARNAEHGIAEEEEKKKKRKRGFVLSEQAFSALATAQSSTEYHRGAGG